MSYTSLKTEDTPGKMELGSRKDTSDKMEQGIRKRPIDEETEVEEETKLMEDGDAEESEEKTPLFPGVYNNYEEVLKVVGFGLGHILLLLGTGVALSSDAVEVLSISFALPIIRKPSELDIENWQNGLLSSVIFIGMLIGGYAWGGIADISGRRLTLITSLTVNGLFGALSAFSPDFYVLLLLRFLSGVGVGGSLPIIMAYNSEFIQSKYRGPYLGVLSCFWMIGALLCGGIAWVLLPLELSVGHVRSWRVYLFASAFPSIIGAVLFIIMPESPRFLLEVGKEKKAIKVLKKLHWLNYFRRQKDPNHHFNIESIQLPELKVHVSETTLETGATVTIKQRVRSVGVSVKEILRRSVRLFHRDLLRSTSIMLVIYFCLSFGSYGVTLWYPTYVDRLSRESLETITEHKDCNHTLSNYTTGINGFSNIERLFCGCPETDYQNVTLEGIRLANTWWGQDSIISDLIVKGGSIKEVRFNNVTMDTVYFQDVVIRNAYFFNSTWKNVYFSNVTYVDNSYFCGIENETSPAHSSNEGLSRTVGSLTANWSCDSALTPPTNCLIKELEVDLEKEYFYDFLIAASAFPGNVVSAIAVYFLTRSYWLAFSLLLSTISVFLLFFVRTEVYAVLILCIFKAITIPGWNVTTLIVAEVYPTYLRTTASGVLLFLARIGAIIGSYVFGAFSGTDQISVPIILTASVLFVSSVISVFLPKTNRTTRLK